MGIEMPPRAPLLYHALPRADALRLALAPENLDRAGAPYAPASLAAEGFVHCSYGTTIAASVEVYFGAAPVVVLVIDPGALGALVVDVAQTPRGPMPHVHGPIPRHAIVASLDGPPDDAARDEER